MNTRPRTASMRLHRLLLAAALAAAAALSACNSARPNSGGDGVPACTRCHGGVDNETGAPPRALDGSNTAAAVGAHTVHLGTDVQCQDCHKVPGSTSDAGHMDNADGRAEITFGPRAQQQGSTPTYDRASLTCNGVYCHKTFQGGAGPANPVWNQPFAGAACGQCHASPPANHPQTLALTDCVTCHSTTVTAQGGIKAGGTHLDGLINAPQGCTGCHGDESRANNKPAPPVDTRGNQASDQVGAHQAHLVAGRLRPALPCSECHVLPTSPAHSNGVTDVPFPVVAGNIGRTGGATPAWDAASGTCSNVYCHGATLPGGSNKTPRFAGGPAEVGIGGGTDVATCGVCHGFPPTGAHPTVDTQGAAIAARTQCNQCHPSTVNAAGEIQLGFHINGALDLTGGHAPGFSNPAVHGPVALGALASCTVCHGADFGTVVNAATTPGKSCNNCHATPGAFGLAFPNHANWQTECTFCHGDPNRAPDASFPTVGQAGVNAIPANKAGPPVVTGKHLVGPGAHQAHYDAATNEYSAALVCTNCHGSPLPSNLDHVVGQVVANWGPLPRTNGVVPSPAAFTSQWEGTPTCTNYCHGATLAGGTKTSPNWLEGATGTSCGSCHAIPMPYTAEGRFHVQNPDCNRCHPGYSPTGVAKATHVDGQATVIALTCTSCHGTAGRVGIAGADSNVAAAPPGTTAGLAAGVRVGAHQAHVNAASLRAAPLICVDCHGTKPQNSPHANGVIGNGFSALAQTNTTATPTAFDAAWEASPTCANYCHGATLAGGSNTTPNWTAGAAQAACGTCHGLPMPYTAAGGFHVQNTDCGKCHTGYTIGAVAKATHIDGAPTVVGLSCTTCHTVSAPFTATTGATASADNRVGAHNKHLTTTNATALQCTDCHAMPGQPKHMSGAVDIAWGARATAAGAAPTPANGTVITGSAVSCANYCHGSTLPVSSAVNRTPSWTATITGCTACHGAPPDGNNNPHQLNSRHSGACATCHYSVMTSTNGGNRVITNPANHINGVRDVQLNPGLTGTITRNANGSFTCNVSGCHSNQTASGW